MTEQEVADAVGVAIDGVTVKENVDMSVTDSLGEVLYINVNGEDFKITVERRL